MLNMVREKTGKNEKKLHELKQSGELYAWKEQIKNETMPEYFNISKTKPLYEVFDYICRNMHINVEKESRFVYSLDYVFLLDEVRGYQFGNITPDYVSFLKYGLEGLRSGEGKSDYAKEYNATIESIKTLINRIVICLEKEPIGNNEKKANWFRKMSHGSAIHFEEAIQRVLFVNQILWQTDHRLIGLGAVDSYLADYYEHDINIGYINKEEAKEILRDFLIELHNYYWLKSNMLMGDTGQIIVIGKSGINGEYMYNDLSILILQIIRELSLPDPKVLLRVNRNTPDDILELAIDCIASGIGSPLLSNDEVVIQRLIEFGIDKEDAYNYTVSACWEPLIGGKSVSLNNMTTFNFMRPLENLFKRDKLLKIRNFEDLLNRYEFYVEKNLNAIKRIIDGGVFQKDTVMSVFIEGCKERDVSRGGAKYFDAGITTVALGNVIDSLLNIKKYVFEEHKYTLLDVKRILILNFNGEKELLNQLKNEGSRYGLDNEETIKLSKRIISMVSKYTENYKSPNGGRLKFGLSAPVYVDAAVGSMASFDGRKSGEPFKVHISNDTATSYTQVINFASAMDYCGNRFNGNVVDIMVNPSLIIENKEKFKYLIIGAINQGFFQIQANVVSSDILIEAKEHPDKHTGLIVRVWGFSAYFIDLPDSYKTVLINRALTNEGKISV